MAVRVFEYTDLAPRVVQALEENFPNAAIRTEEGHGGRVHVRIVSTAFDGQSEKAKQEMVWTVLREYLGDDARGVGFVLPYGMDELP